MEKSFNSLKQLERHVDDSVRMYINRESDDYPRHWHNSYEVIMPIENTYSVAVAEETYVLQPYDILIIPSGVVHEIYAPESGKRYFFMIDQSEFYDIEGIAAVQHCFYPCVFFGHNDESSELAGIRDALAQVTDEFEENDYFARTSIRLWLGVFFVRSSRWLMEKGQMTQAIASAKRHQTTAILLDVCNYIAKNCHEKLCLDDIAAYSGYSKYHFARIFKSFSGMNLYEFYMRQRISLCERLLADSSLTITEVALQAGFDSIATFNRIFKRYENATPSQFRQMLRERNIRIVKNNSNK